VTDEEALTESKQYQKDMYLVTLDSRYYFWVTQFTILTIAMVFIYISAFLITPSTALNKSTLLPKSCDENKVIFALFWLGFYKESSTGTLDIESMSGSSYFAPYWPYFALLMILIFEKVS